MIPTYNEVSIPFIAGQWSLLIAAAAIIAAAAAFQSPSLRGSGRFRSGPSVLSISSRRFNPLHCGAVVASCSQVVHHKVTNGVSIPFIAGQWSLLPFPLPEIPDISLFQSPSLRGSGRFVSLTSKGGTRCSFQSPSLRGSGRFARKVRFKRHGGVEFQSPSLRGSGRFFDSSSSTRWARILFQSPSLRGSGRFESNWNTKRLVK